MNINIYEKEEKAYNFYDDRFTTSDLRNPFHFRGIQNFNNLTPQATIKLIDFLEDMGWFEEYKGIIYKLNTLLTYNLVEVLEGEKMNEED